MGPIAIAALAAAAFAAPAWCQDDQPDCQNAVTQMDMNICAGLDHEEADVALNAVYRDVVAAMQATDAELKDMNPDLIGQRQP